MKYATALTRKPFHFTIGPIDLSLSPDCGSTLKSQTDWLISDAEIISTNAYSPGVRGFCGVILSQCLPGSSWTLTRITFSSWVTAPEWLTWMAPMMRTVLRSSARTMAKLEVGECAPCLRLATSLELPVCTVREWE